MEIYDRDDMARDDFEGMVTIPLRALEHQQRSDEIYKLKDRDGNEEKGEIRLKLHYIWSKYVYYQDLVSRMEQKIEKFQSEMELVNKYVEMLEEPFGLLLFGEIEDLMDKKFLFDHEIIEGSSMRKSYGKSLRTSAKLRESVTSKKSNLLKVDIDLSGTKALLIYGIFVVTMLSLVQRTDFVGVKA